MEDILSPKSIKESVEQKSKRSLGSISHSISVSEPPPHVSEQSPHVSEPSPHVSEQSPHVSAQSPHVSEPSHHPSTPLTAGSPTSRPVGRPRKHPSLTVESVLEENKARFNRLALVGTDQKTGFGIPRHDIEYTLPDYCIPRQWLTPEVANNKMYRKVKSLGSVSAYKEYFNAMHPDTPVTMDMIEKKMLFIRLKEDPYFAFIICFRIQDKQSGRNIPYRLNYAQWLLVEVLEDMRLSGLPIRVVLLKARQWGGSTLTQLYMAWIQLFHKEGWNSVILAQTKDTAKRIKAMYTRVLRYFPSSGVFGVPQIQFSPYEKSVADSIITDKSGVAVRENVITIASYENFESTRGANFAMMHGSEVAYWTETAGKNAEQLITNIDSGILEVPLTLEVLESTANGMSGYFHDEYQLAKQKKSNRRALFIPFYHILHDTIPFRNDAEMRDFALTMLKNQHSTREDSTSESGEYIFSLWEKGACLESINWYVQKRKSFHDHASMAQEAPSDDVECFKHSGHTVFNQYLVDKYEKEYARDPIYTGEVCAINGKHPKLTNRDPEGLFWVWQYADANKMHDRYLVVVDVGGRSTKADYSVITVVDRLPLNYGGKMEVVARWRGHIRYDFLALKAVLIARLYGDALLVFESNTFDKKKAESTEFVPEGDHTRGILASIEDEYENLYMRTSTTPEDLKNGRYKKIGFQTNVKTKQDMVDLMIVSFEDNTRFLDPDRRVYAEMAIYEQREDGSYGNIVGKDNHDDILMTDMIANLVSDEMPLPTQPRAYDPAQWSSGTLNESLL